VRLIAEEGGFAYASDSYADDLPYWMRFGERDQLIIPYTLEANDMRFATVQGFNAGDQFYTYLRDSFDALYAEGMEGAPKMMSVGLHCRLVGRPGRVMALKRFLDYARCMTMSGSPAASTLPGIGPRPTRPSGPT
jgi:peptidoglycan/xylan/chitin deacetylase (PgdA/CDA1 family)